MAGITPGYKQRDLIEPRGCGFGPSELTEYVQSCTGIRWLGSLGAIETEGEGYRRVNLRRTSIPAGVYNIATRAFH